MVPVKLVALFIISFFHFSNGEGIVSFENDIKEMKLQSLEYEAMIADQNTLVAEQEKTIWEQNTVLEQLNTDAESMNEKISQQNIKLSELNIKFSDMLEKENTGETPLPSLTNTVFTRWGRRDCPQTVSELVYSGLVAGSWWEHGGAAVDYLCLPLVPLWDINKHFKAKYNGYVYGGEYQILPNSNLLDYSPPCAVCRASLYSSMIMIPGRNKCYAGWTEAYHGELVTGAFHHKAAARYACLDSNPQINGTKISENGVLMHSTVYKCGSLPCPPYENNKHVTCVVCLK